MSDADKTAITNNNPNPNRLLLFVHFNPHGGLENHVVYTLQQMKSLFAKVVFITNSQLAVSDKDRLSDLCDDFIQRENKGYDFAAWRDGFREISWEETKKYDSVTIMNDTCFGPIYPMLPIYKKLEKSDVDFWGNYAHPATDRGMPGTDEPIPKHIQSYFAVYSKEVTNSQIFYDFWNEVKDHIEVEKVIQDYETQLTKMLVEDGFKYDTIVPDSLGLVDNAMILSAEALVELGIPFVKIKAFDWYHNLPNNLIARIKRKTDYPTDYILEYFNRNMLRPPADVLLFDRFISSNNEPRDYSATKIAISIHAYYVDVFEQYLDHLDKLTYKFDLYVTSNTLAKKHEIESIINKRKISYLKEIIVTPNKGRDMVPWLCISDKLNMYDIVGKFHTKKSTETNFLGGEMWQEDMWYGLIENSEKIVNEFIDNPSVGIVIPDIPRSFHFEPTTIFTEDLLKNLIEKTWKRMAVKKYDFSLENISIFAYGSMFWYRPEALNPLTELKLGDKDIPAEPLGQSLVTVLHALERLPVYVARSQGYFFRIARVPNTPSGFVDNATLNRMLRNAAIVSLQTQTGRMHMRGLYHAANNSPRTHSLMFPARLALHHARKMKKRLHR